MYYIIIRIYILFEEMKINNDGNKKHAFFMSEKRLDYARPDIHMSVATLMSLPRIIVILYHYMQ